jgi:hypothetical protein
MTNASMCSKGVRPLSSETVAAFILLLATLFGRRWPPPWESHSEDWENIPGGGSLLMWGRRNGGERLQAHPRPDVEE